MHSYITAEATYSMYESIKNINFLFYISYHSEIITCPKLNYFIFDNNSIILFYLE